MNTNNLWGWIPFLTGQTIYWVIVGVKYHSSKKCYNDISAIRYLCRPKFSFETLPSNPHEVPKKLHFKSIILMMYIECLKYVELCCIICRQHCFVIQEPGVLLSIIAYSLHEQLLNQFFVKNPSRVLPRIVMDKDLAKKHNYKKSMKNKGWNLSKCNTFSMIEHYLSVFIPSLWLDVNFQSFNQLHILLSQDQVPDGFKLKSTQSAGVNVRRKLISNKSQDLRIWVI